MFGRFNPPTIGHEKLLKAAGMKQRELGQNLRYTLPGLKMQRRILIQEQNKLHEKNVPDYEESIMDDGSKTIFDVLTSAYNAGYKNATVVVGQDRLAEFQVSTKI